AAARMGPLSPWRGRTRTGCPEGSPGTGRARHTRLSFPIVAQPPRLQDGRAAEGSEGGARLRRTVDATEGGDRNAKLGDELLFGQSILSHLQRPSARAHRHEASEVARGLHRHVLELEGDGIDAGRECRKRRPIVEGSPGGARRHVASGPAVGAVNVRLEPETRCGHGEHAPELTAAQDAYGGAGRQGRGARILRHRPSAPQERKRTAGSEKPPAAWQARRREAPESAPPAAPHWWRRACQWPASPRARPPASARSTISCPVRTAPRGGWVHPAPADA